MSLEALEDEGEYYDEDDICNVCDGEGTILVCIDDMCHGLGYCIHGDGEVVCPACKGNGCSEHL